MKSVFILALLVSAAVVSARPEFEPFRGLEEMAVDAHLKGHARRLADGAATQEVSVTDDVGSHTRFEYNVVPHSQLVTVDSDENVEEVVCDDTTLRVRVNDMAGTESWTAGSIIAGGPEWGCREEHRVDHHFGESSHETAFRAATSGHDLDSATVFYRRVITRRPLADGWVLLHTKPASLAECFAGGDVKFRWTPPKHTSWDAVSGGQRYGAETEGHDHVTHESRAALAREREQPLDEEDPIARRLQLPTDPPNDDDLPPCTGAESDGSEGCYEWLEGEQEIRKRKDIELFNIGYDPAAKAPVPSRKRITDWATCVDCHAYLSIFFDVDISFNVLPPGIKRFHAITGGDAAAGAKLEVADPVATLEKALLDLTERFGGRKWKFQFNVFGVPVIFYPYWQLRARVEATNIVEGALTVGYRFNASAELGIRYRKGDGWTPVRNFGWDREFVRPRLRNGPGDADLRVTVVPQLTFSLYNVVPLVIALEPYIGMSLFTGEVQTNALPYDDSELDVRLTIQRATGMRGRKSLSRGFYVESSFAGREVKTPSGSDSGSTTTWGTGGIGIVRDLGQHPRSVVADNGIVVKLKEDRRLLRDPTIGEERIRCDLSTSACNWQAEFGSTTLIGRITYGTVYAWDTDDWSTCTSACGGGTQSRVVTCRDQSGNGAADSACAAIEKPATQQTCGTVNCDQYGAVRLTVIRAEGLRDRDGFGGGDSDPYAKVSIDGKTYQTDRKKNDNSPTWNQQFDCGSMSVFTLNKPQGLTVHDHDGIGKDDGLGGAPFTPAVPTNTGGQPQSWTSWVNIGTGRVQLKLDFTPVGNNAALQTVVPVAQCGLGTEDAIFQLYAGIGVSFGIGDIVVPDGIPLIGGKKLMSGFTLGRFNLAAKKDLKCGLVCNGCLKSTEEADQQLEEAEREEEEVQLIEEERIRVENEAIVRQNSMGLYIGIGTGALGLLLVLVAVVVMRRRGTTTTRTSASSSTADLVGGVSADAPLPAGWESSQKDGRTFYFNRSTGVTQWERPQARISSAPPPLPEGWQAAAENGKTYYYNRKTGETSWTPPSML